MNRKKYTILAAFVGLLFTAQLTFGQANSEGTKSQGANVLLRFAKDGTLNTNCSETLGLITQSVLQVEGVKNVKLDAKNNGVQVSYDPGKTTPQKIVASFNKDNPDTLLALSDTKLATRK